jgi:MoxR-like ATPase
MQADALQKLRENITSVYMGNTAAVDRVIVCLLARGHLLIEDVPGVGKTVLAGSPARSRAPSPASSARRTSSRPTSSG